jgi:Bacterial Ig-like domain (group 1)
MTSLLRKLGSALGLLATAALLNACGGSGAGAGGAGTSTGGASSALKASTAASLTLTADSTTIDSDGKKIINLTAITKTADNVVLKNAPISFSTTDAGTTLTPSDTKTNDGGIVTALVKTTDKTTRVIKITAQSDTLSASIELSVVGTTLSVNGPTGLGFGAESEYSIVLKDSGGNAIAGQTVTVTTGNTLTVKPGVTDAQGQAKFKISGSKAGADVLSVAAMGATATFAISVTPKQLVFEAPGSLAEFPVGASQPGNLITIRLLDNGVPQVGKSINLVATRGTVQTPAGAVISTQPTGADGRVTFALLSPSAGLSTLTATSDDVVVSLKLEFVARVPTQISLQAGPSVVGVNLSSATSNSAQLIARVTDGINPVKGVRVDFSAIADPSAGRIEPAFGITDSYGQATSSFFGGAAPTGNELVVLKAAVVTGSGPVVIPATAKLTVAQQEISIRLGSSTLIQSDDLGTKYAYPHTVLVTDNAGRPIAGALVTVTAQPRRYFKGRWVKSPNTAGSLFWAMDYSALCPSEDVNLNGQLDPGEDSATDPLSFGNGNGRLEPGNVASAEVTEVGSRTNNEGFAGIMLRYPKIYGLNAEINLTVSILAPAGTEAKQNFVTLLVSLKNDLIDTDAAPPGILVAPTVLGIGSARYISPFGEASSCRDPK